MSSKKQKPMAPEMVMSLPSDERIVLKSIGDQPAIPLEDARKICEGVVEPRKCAFLLALAQLGSRNRAAKASDISPMTAWLWRRDDENFKAAYDRAISMAAELMEDELYRRACEGVLEPVFQGGKLVGSLRRYSDTLLIFGLKGAMPEKYKDNIKMEHTGEIDIVGRLKAARERALGRGEDDKG